MLRDSDVASAPTPFRDLFFPPHLNQQQWYYGIRFMGFFIQDPADGRVIGQFPHLFPASIAIGYGLNGLSGARQAVAVVGHSGTGRRVLRRRAHRLADARHLRRRYCSRSTSPRCGLRGIRTAKSVMQALMFAALLAFARALEGSRTFFGAIAGGLLGLMLFLCNDVVLAMAAFVAAATVMPVNLGARRRGLRGVARPHGSCGDSGDPGEPDGSFRVSSAYPWGSRRDLGGCGLLIGLGPRRNRGSSLWLMRNGTAGARRAD